MLTEEQVAEKMAELEAAKAALAKAEEEKENYRKGLLSREEELKTLKSSKEEGKEDEKDDEKEIEWDENSKKFQEETLSKTAKLAEEAAVAAAMKAINSTNEKTAQEKFRASHPEVTDEEWADIMANYTPKLGAEKDLERALILTKFDKGEIIDPAEINRRQAEERNRDMNISHGTPSSSGKYEEQKGGVTEGQKALASRFGISVERLEKEDDSRQATISIIKR
jgi:hypothetical protein